MSLCNTQRLHFCTAWPNHKQQVGKAETDRERRTEGGSRFKTLRTVHLASSHTAAAHLPYIDAREMENLGIMHIAVHPRWNLLLTFIRSFVCIQLSELHTEWKDEVDRIILSA